MIARHRALSSMVVLSLVGCGPAPADHDGGTSLDAGTLHDASPPLDAGEPDGSSPSGTDSGVSDGGSSGPESLLPCADVEPTGDVLVDLGHWFRIRAIELAGERVASLDDLDIGSEPRRGHWVLWDRTSHRPVASGTGLQIALRHSLFAALTSSGIELRDAADGHTLAMISGSQSQLGIAPDAGYVWASSASALSVFSPTGATLFMRPGDYSAARVFATSSELRIANGPAGPNVIESVAVPSGTSTISSAFLGAFHSWFASGDRFFTSTGTTYRIYGADATQQGIVSVDALTVESVVGGRDYFYEIGGSVECPDSGCTWTAFMRSYAVDDPSMSVDELTQTSDIAPLYWRLAGDVAFVTLGLGSPELLGRDGRVGVSQVTDGMFSDVQFVQVPGYDLSAIAAESATSLVFGTGGGAIYDYDGEGFSPLGCGQALSVAGNAGGLAAIATVSGQVLVVDVNSRTLTRVVPMFTDNVGLGDNGVLVGSRNNQAAWHEAWVLAAYDLNTGTRILDIDMTPLEPWDTWLPGEAWISKSGSRIGQVWGTAYSVLDLTGAQTDLGEFSSADGTPFPIVMSPDGHRVALQDSSPTDHTATNVFEDGALITAVPGVPLGWVDDDRFLVAAYVFDPGTETYVWSSAALFDTTGTMVAPTTLPELLRAQPMGDGTTVFAPEYNQILDVYSGGVVWQGMTRSYGAASVAGRFVVYSIFPQLDPHIMIEEY